MCRKVTRELQKIWNVKVKIIPLVVTVGTAQVQKTDLLGKARILRKVLEI